MAPSWPFPLVNMLLCALVWPDNTTGTHMSALSDLLPSEINTTRIGQGFHQIQAFGPQPSPPQSVNSDLSSTPSQRTSSTFSALPNLPTLPGVPVSELSTSTTGSTSSKERSVSSPSQGGASYSPKFRNSTASQGTRTSLQYRPPQAPRSNHTVAPPLSPTIESQPTLQGPYRPSNAAGTAPLYQTAGGRSSSGDSLNTAGHPLPHASLPSPTGYGSGFSWPTGTAKPHKPSSFGKPQYGNSTGIYGSESGTRYASGITLGAAFTANTSQASTIWGRNPACTASWKSRLAANNGTVMTTKVYSRTISLSTPFTSTWALDEPAITGPTTETINAGKSLTGISHSFLLFRSY